MDTPPTHELPDADSGGFGSGDDSGDWLLQQLSALPAPPAPAARQFDRVLHERINKRLLVGQMLDLGLRALPYAALHLGLAVVGAIQLTITGCMDAPRSHRHDERSI